MENIVSALLGMEAGWKSIEARVGVFLCVQFKE